MNRFRVNLHPALFFPGSDVERSTGEHTDDNGSEMKVETSEERALAATERARDEEKGQEVADNKEQEGKIVDAVAQGTEFASVADDVKRMSNSNQEHLKRFDDRCNALYENKDKYSKVWERKINEGYGHLLTALKENNYFDDCKTEEERKAKENTVKEQYRAEVKKQYKEKILDAKDSKFNAAKDTIFGREFQDYPANKIYCELTGAASIFTADRTYMHGYGAEILDDVDGEDPEDMSARKDRKFLSKDLPRYLWDLKKTPQSMNLLIFKIKVNKPSNEDTKAISNLLKVSSRLNVPADQDAALALLKAFKTNRLSANSGVDAYKKVLGESGISAKKEKYWDDIVKVGNFYFNTQSENLDTKSQHAIYLSVLEIIETEGGVDNAVKKWKKLVDEAKKDKKEEKRNGGYENGEKLGSENSELYEIAKGLGITDFTSATRLAEKGEDYFKNTPVENILANINNDRVLDARDTIIGGSKTGQQFIEVFNQVGKDQALTKLVERAKLLNKTLGIGLPEPLFNKTTIEADIKGGHTGLILLLQNIINNPGEDLLTLLGDKTRIEFDKQLLDEAKQKSEVAAKEMAGKVNLEGLKQLGLDGLPSPEELQSGLAASLYTEYTKGIGLGSKISFDEWVKGLAMNTGFQVRDDGGVVLGIGLSYKKDINLGKGWSMTPMASAGGFIPLGYGRPELGGSAGFNVELAKKWITENGVAQKIGFDTGVTVMNTGVVILSAGMSWYRDKLAGIESREQEKRGEMAVLVKSMLDEYFQKVYQATGIKTPSLDLENPVSRNVMRDVIKTNAQKQGVKPNEIDTVVNATMRLLLPYQGAELIDSQMKNMIAAGVADQYAMAWAEARKAHISDSTYLSGANLGAFWVVGSPLVGIYAGMERTKHNLDGYGDRWGRAYSLDHQYEGGRNADFIKGFNQEAGFKGNDVLSISEVEGKKYIMIPKNLTFRVRVNEKLKGNMKKDARGNILLHVQTPMAAKIHRGSATQGSEIIIGGRKGENFSFLDKVGNDWFTTDELNQTEILNLGEGIRTYNAEVINKSLAELKTKFPAGDKIQKFEIDEAKMRELIDAANEINNKEKPHKVKLVIDEGEGGKLEVSLVESKQEGRGLEMEYKARFEMMDSKAKEIAKLVYDEALRVKDPTALHEVKHQPWAEYKAFKEDMKRDVEAGKEPDYEAARRAIKPIFEKLDKQIKGANFTRIGNQLDKITDYNALGQALMSINNIFARSRKVIGGGGEYKFTTSMGNIIAEREGQISKTIRNYNGDNITQKVKKSYQSLIDASAEYRKESKVFDKMTSAGAAQLGNTVGFNLGDKTNPENPLFNPEIYNPMVEMKNLERHGFDAEQRKALQERAMKLFANNEALITPILKYLGLEGKKVDIKAFEMDGEKGKLALDIGEGNDIKKITLNAGMKFGYFTQCVNHTVILDDLSAETEDGTSVQFNSGVWEDGIYREGDKNSMVSSTKVDFGGAVTLGEGQQTQDAITEQEGGTSTGSGTGGTEQGGSTGTGEGLGGDNSGNGGGGR